MFEKFLHQTPYLRFALPLIFGIVFQIIFPDFNIPLIIPAILISLVIYILHFSNQTQYFYTNRIWGFLVSVFIFILGIYLVKSRQESKPYFKQTEQTFITTVIKEPSEKENTFQTTLKVNFINDSTEWIPKQAQLLAYFEKDSSTENLQFGDQLVIKAYLNPVKHSGNPYTFNYKKYLAFRDIYYQTYIKSENFKVLMHNNGPWLYRFSHKIRKHLLNIYKQNNIDGNEFAVLSALTLGYKAELNPEIRDHFSTSGAMHILAVSGLHVGIIYIILARILFFLRRNKYGRVLQSLIIIFALFFYALLTGLSSSVLRATIMFSIISLGKIFVRQNNIYNTIFVSAFVMLLANPYSITDVGFQLSYMGVFSIIFFYPKIYGLFHVKYSFADKIWQLISVAIAAQIGTFPLSIYYFDQFPVYFILANIFIIPMAMILIYGAVTLFFLSFSDGIISFLAPAVKYITFGLNYAVKTISELPFSKIHQINVDLFQVIILIAVVLMVSFFIITKRLRYLRLSILLFLLIPCYSMVTKYLKSKELYFIIYNIPDVSAIDFVKHSKNQLYINKQATLDSQIIQYNILPFWQKQQIRKPEIRFINDHIYHNYQFRNQKIIQINNDSLFQYKTSKQLDVDYIVLSENPNLDIKRLASYFNFKKVIFDSSNDFYTIKKWQQQSNELGIDYYTISEQGAFVKKF
ncbi:MAG: ComEC/Rec2 family competence protein [Bacteroidales bacterium]